MGDQRPFILSLGEFEELMDDLEDLAAIAERLDEPTTSHEDVVAELKRDGLLEDLEELESIRAYELAKASGEKPIPFEQAVQETERNRR